MATMVMLVIQIIGFFSTCIFYWFASSEGTRYFLSRAIFTALYHREDWPYLKRQQALELHVLIAGSIQLLLLPATILLLIGAISRTRWLLLPWLTLFALFQLCVLFSVIACILWLPKSYKLLAAAVASVEAFILFPWWFATLHLFSALNRLKLLGKAERAYNLNAADLTSALEAYSSPRSLSRRTSRASILPYDGSEMIVPVMIHSNAGTLKRGMISQRQSIIPYDGSEMIMPAIMHSNGGTLQRNGTLRSCNNHCCTYDRTSYSTAGVGSSHQTGYSDLDV